MKSKLIKQDQRGAEQKLVDHGRQVAEIYDKIEEV